MPAGGAPCVIAVARLAAEHDHEHNARDRDEQQQRKGRVELRHERDGPRRALGAHYGQG